MSSLVKHFLLAQIASGYIAGGFMSLIPATHVKSTFRSSAPSSMNNLLSGYMHSADISFITSLLFLRVLSPQQSFLTTSKHMSSHHLARPTTKEIFRYRYQHGASLAGVFVLDQRLYPEMFDQGAAGPTELDAVVSSLNVRGLDETREKWEAHWAKGSTNDDLQWLTVTARCNHVRLPIGYHTLGPEFCRNTPFAMQPAQVYVHAWAAVKELCRRCYAFGIGVLLSFQDALEVAGSDATKVSTWSVCEEAEPWEVKSNFDVVLKSLTFIADQISRESDLAGVIGIEVNYTAAPFDGDRGTEYAKALARLSEIDASIPVYVGDFDHLGETLKWSLTQNVLHGQRGNPILVSTRRSYAGEEGAKGVSGHEIVSSVFDDLQQKSLLRGNSVTDIKGATAIYVADYSCSLPAPARKGLTKEQYEDLVIQFGRHQTRRWHEKASGSAFWTWHAANLPSAGFDFKTQVETGSIFSPTHLSLTKSEITQRLVDADHKRSQLMTSAMEKHLDYFDKVGGKYEHWRYADGWHLGFTDARAFFAARTEVLGPVLRSPLKDDDYRIGTDRIGALDLWVLKRMREEDSVSRDRCEFVWEWEHGFRAGVRAFYRLVGIQN